MSELLRIWRKVALFWSRPQELSLSYQPGSREFNLYTPRHLRLLYEDTRIFMFYVLQIAERIYAGEDRNTCRNWSEIFSDVGPGLKYFLSPGRDDEVIRVRLSTIILATHNGGWYRSEVWMTPYITSIGQHAMILIKWNSEIIWKYFHIYYF